ncbi:PREDICTED: disease resistance protein RPS6-like [Camelina sativa]|uniref:Disease resistance protein RPS6-like n=1 Tax=Camelina sativa TaxID=90675 RepID=A0ABM1QTJ4_CAMSA|nr:PREDICTED: disease resistance protein RPS6-like [Camelina sativa]
MDLSSRNWVYDVFPSFSGEDVRVTFLSHFLKELDRKLISVFTDGEIKRSQSLDPELTQAIRDSRIAVVVFSKNYASSSWCLNELSEIVKCREEFGQNSDSCFQRFGSFSLVLDALASRTPWFGCGSRIIVVTQDKQFLRAHGIDLIYQVGLPSDKLALEMLCRSAFKQKTPPDGFTELVSEVAKLSGNLPLALNVLGSHLRGRDKEDWIDMLPRLRKGLDGKIEIILRVGYDGLSNKDDQALFRLIACFFNGADIGYIKLLLADSDLGVNIGFKNLVDKSLIYVGCDTVEMHSMLQEMGREIVRKQSIDQPGEREFLVDSMDILDLLHDNTGTKKVLGISLDMSEIEELHIHKKAFKRMPNLRFLRFYKKLGKQTAYMSQGDAVIGI